MKNGIFANLKLIFRLCPIAILRTAAAPRLLKAPPQRQLQSLLPKHIIMPYSLSKIDIPTIFHLKFS